MNEIGYQSMSAASFNQDNISKLFSDTYSRIPDATYTTSNSYTIADVETKEILNLKRTVNRLEKNISFIQYEHNQMLKGLQNQVDKLREENQELQFQLVMRSSRTTIDGLLTNSSIIDHVHAKPVKPESESVSTQILQLNLALEKERALNNELVRKLEFFELGSGDMKHADAANTAEIPTNPNTVGEEISISSKIRISLQPLTVSLYHEDTGQYVKNYAPSREDCEIVIKTLLQNPKTHSDYPNENNEASMLNIIQKRKHQIPIIRKPLQIVKQYPRNSASIKLNPLSGSICSKPIELLSSSHQKLSPILSNKSINSNVELDSFCFDANRPSEKEYQKRNMNSAFSEKSIGSSLPALPKPTEYNQAEKQRRLQVLQKKRLDQFNSKH